MVSECVREICTTVMRHCEGEGKEGGRGRGKEGGREGEREREREKEKQGTFHRIRHSS